MTTLEHINQLIIYLGRPGDPPASLNSMENARKNAQWAKQQAEADAVEQDKEDINMGRAIRTLVRNKIINT